MNVHDAMKATIVTKKVFLRLMIGSAQLVTTVQEVRQTLTSVYQEPISRRKVAQKRKTVSHALLVLTVRQEIVSQLSVYLATTAHLSLLL